MAALLAAVATAVATSCSVAAPAEVERATALPDGDASRPPTVTEVTAPPLAPTTGSTPGTDPAPPATLPPPAPGGPLVDVPVGDVLAAPPERVARPYDGLLAAALADLEAWWGETYPALHGEPWEPLAGGVFPSYPGRTDVPGCGATGTEHRDVAEYAAFYCASGDFLVFDDGPDSLLGELAAEFGDVVVGVVLAHEYGHVVQERTGDLERRLPTVVTEQQADCFAGAWMAHTATTSPWLRTGDADLRGALVAMVTVRDPVGLDTFADGGHGSAFDRVGAFQEGFAAGAERCAELLDEPLPLVPNEFLSESDRLNEGDLPFGYDDGQIVPLIVDALEAYWAFQLDDAGAEPLAVTVAPVDDLAGAACRGDLTVVVPGVGACRPDGVVVLDDTVARAVYDDPIDGRADFAVGYLLATGWADLAQDRLGSRLEGEPRALANDCLVGAFARDLDPTRPNRPGEPERRGTLSPGDLDEAVLAAIGVGDGRRDDDVIGSPFEKIDAFRRGVLVGFPACRDMIGS